MFQWRKGLQLELDDEDVERERQLSERQHEHEEIERLREESRKLKLKERSVSQLLCDVISGSKHALHFPVALITSCNALVFQRFRTSSNLE